MKFCVEYTRAPPAAVHRCANRNLKRSLLPYYAGVSAFEVDQDCSTSKSARCAKERKTTMTCKRAIFPFLPICIWLPKCSSADIRTDIIAGIALAGLLIPEGMAYAGIAGVPPQMGLYAAMLGMFVYAIFGTSRQLAVTATSSSAAMLSALVAPHASGDPARYAMLASAATVAAGLVFLAGGVLKLGAVSEFISKPVLKGFVFGLALTIMVKQAHKIMGISAGHGNFNTGFEMNSDTAQIGRAH